MFTMDMHKYYKHGTITSTVKMTFCTIQHDQMYRYERAFCFDVKHFMNEIDSCISYSGELLRIT